MFLQHWTLRFTVSLPELTETPRGQWSGRTRPVRERDSQDLAGTAIASDEEGTEPRPDRRLFISNTYHRRVYIVTMSAYVYTAASSTALGNFATVRFHCFRVLKLVLRKLVGSLVRFL
jgi:hypothetical protein